MNRPKPTQSSDDAEGWNEDFSTMRRNSQPEEDFDPVNLVASERSLSEQLLMDVSVAIDVEDVAIADYLIGNLDERGFLSMTVEEVAEMLDVDEDRVEEVLKSLQSVGPVGVGARDIQECLLLQLDFLEDEGEGTHQTFARCKWILKDLVSTSNGHIAQELGISTDEVTAVRDFIKDRLNPYPMQDYRQAQTWSSPSRSAYVTPDVIISDRLGKLEAEVVESKHFLLRVNPMYRSLMAELDDKAKAYSDEDRQHIRHTCPGRGCSSRIFDNAARRGENHHLPD